MRWVGIMLILLLKGRGLQTQSLSLYMVRASRDTTSLHGVGDFFHNVNLPTDTQNAFPRLVDAYNHNCEAKQLQSLTHSGQQCLLLVILLLMVQSPRLPPDSHINTVNIKFPTYTVNLSYPYPPQHHPTNKHKHKSNYSQSHKFKIS